MKSTTFGRRGAVLAVATAAASLAAIAFAAPAQAAALGKLTLTPAHGTITANPMFTTATTSAACPAGYGDNASLRVGRAGGPFVNLRPGSAGSFATAPFSLSPNRSFNTAVGTATGNGTWVVIVQCGGEINGLHPDRFETTISVWGDKWWWRDC